MDNSPAWDEPLANVPPVEWYYQRRDLTLVESDQRPTHEQYDRYLYLVDFLQVLRLRQRDDLPGLSVQGS